MLLRGLLRKKLTRTEWWSFDSSANQPLACVCAGAGAGASASASAGAELSNNQGLTKGINL